MEYNKIVRMEWDQMCRDRSHHCLLHNHLADAMAHGHLEYHPKNLEERVLVLQVHEELGEWQIVCKEMERGTDCRKEPYLLRQELSVGYIVIKNCKPTQNRLNEIL
ncbi:uncharacterized protein LOC124358399 [Homalodisca vitripennis]|uniref:uncharacterized protein LOC124358399 n=1 Tax=Homalodisca vitripennis TaxID=197043 RepID=UPI001EECD33A|nr:uncharacterized protein LOC124358399 [Homalodisca vitripennis]